MEGAFERIEGKYEDNNHHDKKRNERMNAKIIVK